MADGVNIELEGVAMRLATHPRVWNPTSFARSFAGHLAQELHPGQRALEVGLGSGVLAILGGAKGVDVDGLDINVDAVRMTTENWASHGLPVKPDRFRHSDRFTALSDDARYDLVWSNPPVLPDLPHVAATGDRNDFEVAGDHGRLVLDALITEAGRYLAPGGTLLTIATSLQGQGRTEALLDTHWSSWVYTAHLELALTDECGPPYVDWWRARTAEDGQRRVYRREGDERWWHDVWILRATGPKGV